ncbi:MAG: Ig-like domain-containing protein [Verrucomicrobiota bacterium]
MADQVSASSWDPRTSPARNPVTYTPNPNYNGPDSFAYAVTDQGGLSSGPVTVLLQVEAQNDPPTISSIPNQLIEENTASAAISFTIGDAETPAGQLDITAVSTDSVLIPSTGLQLQGSGTNRTVTITPAPNEIGTATITLTVSDTGSNPLTG